MPERAIYASATEFNDTARVSRWTHAGQLDWQRDDLDDFSRGAHFDPEGFVYAWTNENEIVEKLDATDGTTEWQSDPLSVNLQGGGIAIDEHYIYLADWDHIILLDKSDGSVVNGSGYDYGEVIRGISAAGGYCFVGTGNGQASRIDFSDPQNPGVDWTFDTQRTNYVRWFAPLAGGDQAVYIAEANTSGGERFWRVDEDGFEDWEYDDAQSISDEIFGLATDHQGYAYCIWDNNDYIRKIDPQGNDEWQADVLGGVSSQTRQPGQISVDPEGCVYYTNDDEEIVKLSPDGQTVEWREEWSFPSGSTHSVDVEPGRVGAFPAGWGLSPGIVAGVVRDFGGDPVEGAEVFVMRDEGEESAIIRYGTTNAAGEFHFEVPAETLVHVLAQHEDGEGNKFNARSQPFVVAEAEDEENGNGNGE